MPRFFVPSDGFSDREVTITGDDAWHIARSLRMAVGEEITVCDMHGNVHTCVLKKITDTSAEAEITGTSRSQSEMPVRVVLYQAFPKGDKMDVIVQKAVEEGVYAVVPFLSERCVWRPDKGTVDKKLVRWRRIALEAAKQCGRGIIPEIREPLTYRQMLDEAAKAAAPCFCYEGDGTVSFRKVLTDCKTAYADSERADDTADISVVIGSEGGFSGKEAETASAHGFAMCNLGRRILRCESASGYALACVSYEFEL